MRRYVQELKPTAIHDLAAMVALYRPGPMQHIPTYIRAKHGLEEIRYPHPDLADILDETYGVIVYQDQVLLIAQKFAGYTLGEADVMRKAMGKKIAAVMRAERRALPGGGEGEGLSARPRPSRSSTSSSPSPATPSTRPTPSPTPASPTRPPT